MTTKKATDWPTLLKYLIIMDSYQTIKRGTLSKAEMTPKKG